MPRDNLYLVEIVEAIDRISRWLSKVDANGWNDDDMLRAAVLQQLTTIGEASRSVSSKLREQHSEVPWRRIADFRNVAVHYRAFLDAPDRFLHHLFSDQR